MSSAAKAEATRAGSWLCVSGVAAILIAVCVHYGNLAAPALSHGDEALTALRAESLLHEGHFWTPHWNGTVNLHKPPLYYWLVATAMGVLGPTEVAVRLPSVLAFLGLLVLAYQLGVRSVGRPAGLLACLLLASCPVLVEQSRLGMMDTLVTLLFFAGALALWGSRERRRLLYAWGAACGLALLAKGGGAILPLPVGLIYLAVADRRAYRSKVLYGALGVALVIPGVWFLSQFLMHRDAFVGTYITWEVKYRLEGHRWWETFLAQHTTRRLWQALGALGPACLVACWPALAPRDDADRRLRYWVIMALVAMLLTNLIKQQMYWYVLPGLVPLLMLLGAALAASGKAETRTWQVVALGLALVAGTWLPHMAATPAAVLWAARGCALIACLACIWKAGRPLLAPVALGVTVVILAWPGHTFTNGGINLARHRDGDGLKALALQVPPAAGRDDSPLVCNFRHYPMNVLMFYTGRRAVGHEVLEAVPADVTVRYGVYHKSSDYKRYAHYAAETIAQEGDYRLVRLTSRVAEMAQP